MAETQWTRRRFLAASAASGISLSISRLALSAEEFDAHETMPIAPGWSNGIGQPRYRVDGYAKVTGAKLYARDFRAADIPGWPQDTSRALLLYARDASRRFTGIDLSSLDPGLQPDRTVVANDLTAAGIKSAGFFEGDLLCPEGQTPAYLGQPVALLIYHDFARFDAARQQLRGRTDVATFGAETGPVTRKPYGANRFTRIGGPGRKGPDVYSPFQDGWVVPVRYRKGGAPEWAEAEPNGTVAEEASTHGAAIRKDLAEGHSGRVFTQSFETPSNDHFFMEPESGLAWYDKDQGRLALLVGVQAPGETMKAIAEILTEAQPDFAVREIAGNFTFLGGGFGGKDMSIVPQYLALAGLFAEGRPVRLALDRFEQFQLGLKRHATTIDSSLGVDPESGAFQAFVCDLSLNGGGLANYSASIAEVSGVSSASIYYLPRSDVTTVAEHSRAVTAGSMRCYGAYQSLVAMECLVDQAARGLEMDPIALRRKNALQTGELTLTGIPPNGALRTHEVLDGMEASALWQDREANRKSFEAADPTKAYGIGVACVNFKYGTGEDGSLTALSFDAEGRISVAASSVEMGTGTSTAVAVRVADHLGRSADHVTFEAKGPFWEALGLETSGDPWTISQAEQDRAAKNPRWVPQITSRASASVGAHVTTHGVAEAARTLLRFGLWPAARAIWQEGPAGGQAAGEEIALEDLRWAEGKLTALGMEPLSFERLAKKAHEMGLVTGVMLHAYNRWEWSTAKFRLDGTDWSGAFDSLAIRQANKGWQRLDRREVQFPPAIRERVGASYFSTCGAVVALSVDRSNGKVEVLDVHQVLDCGRVLIPNLVSGITQGGTAMGIGHALFEYLPLYEDGPGKGDWNVNRYHVVRARDLPVWNMTLETLPPLSDSDPPKGMAEVIMIPVVSGILNAIFDAIGHRFTKLPVTADDIARAL